ncbi:MAG: diguanylate cyclase [Rhodobacterales bacterium]|nr:MAG: diguanylate cyclase [Rhodobacterales bacterium]
MSAEITQAFEHPLARSEGSGGDELDRISLRDHVVAVEIGAFQSERGTTQRVAFNIVVEVRPPEGPLRDDVDRILSYDTITEAIATELASERLNLLETLAERIAQRILTAPQAERVFVRIEKLDRGPGALGVEIVRRRGEAVTAPEDAVPHPRLVFLDNAAIDAPALGAALDRLEAGALPVILCVGLAPGARVQTGDALTQRRIDLLSIEQNAWRLAARDRRCVVVDSRTELDWAMKQGNLSVWAPSKMVLDAVDNPLRGAVDPEGLARWLSGELSAQGIDFVSEKTLLELGQ